MAALYLHNAIFIPETPRSGDLPAPHTRTLSSGTLRTVASEGHPTEPLLDTQTPDHQSQAFQELLSLQPSHPHGPDAGWDMRLSLDGLRSGRSSPGVVGEEAIRRRLNQLRWAIVVIQLIIAVWVTYTAIRYFISFGKYQSSAGQSLSVALGTSSLVSVVYLACTQAMRVARPYLASFDVPLRYIRIAETIFRALASIFFATPALINFILVLIYKSSGNYEMVVSNRCVLDADLVWAGGNSSCTNSESQWGAWVGLSALRLILTVALVVIFHSCVLSFQHIVLYPTGKNYTEPPHRRRNKRSSKSHQTGTTSTSRAHLTSPPMSMSSASSFPTTIQPIRHPSVSQSSANSAQLLALARVPSDPNQVGRVSPSRVQASTHRSRSTSPSQHPAHYYTESDVERLARTSQGSSSPAGDPGPSSASNMDDRELNAFVDQFRSMVTQISREAEEAIEFAQPGPTGSYRNSFDMGPPLPSAIIGYDELGRPYGAEEHVRILNGFVRRMPTIESIGSRELGSMRSMASNLEQERIERMTSLQELSRPGTQLTMRTDTTTTDYGQIIRSGLYGPGSAPPSRSNSINTGPSRANSVNWTGTPVTTHPEFEAPWANGQQPPSPVSPISPIAAAILRGSSIAASSGSSSGHSTSEATTGSGAASFHTAGSGNDRSTEPRQPLIPHPYRTASPTEMSPV